MSRKLVLGRLLHCLADPAGGEDRIEYWHTGAMLLDAGKIIEIGDAPKLREDLDEAVEVIDHADQLILPGLIDCHVHYPQTDVIASFGEQLLSWLENYTFPREASFHDETLAASTAEFFLDELLRNGTTTALVFATVHPGSVDALFSAASTRNMRLAAGKVLMDQNCPENLRDSAESGYADSRSLLERWHGDGRLHYAITPRFAATSTEAQLRRAGQLAREYPDVLVHTHLAENTAEIDWVKELHPSYRSYTNVYEETGLMRERAVFAHCIHLDEPDYHAFKMTGSGMAFCPTSNLFLGSGLFDLRTTETHGIPVGLGTDVGGGTSFSLLRTMSEAYKVLQLRQQTLSGFKALYLATLGAAETLGMDDKIGNFVAGKEADFIVLNQRATPLIERRLKAAETLKEEWFVQMMLGDDRSISETYLMGEAVSTSH